MNLEDLRSVRNTERRKDSLQELRPTFYRDVGQYIGALSDERARLAATSDDPFADPEIVRLTNEIQTATDVAEAIYERRMGKVVKQASLAAAGMTASVDGLTAEEEALFDDLVARIEANKAEVFAVLDGDDSFDSGTTDGESVESPTPDVERENDRPESADGSEAHRTDSSSRSPTDTEASPPVGDPEGERNADGENNGSLDGHGSGPAPDGLDAAAVMGAESSVDVAESSIDVTESGGDGPNLPADGAESARDAIESTSDVTESRGDTIESTTDSAESRGDTIESTTDSAESTTDSAESTTDSAEMGTPPPPPPDAERDPATESGRSISASTTDEVDRLTVRITTDVGSILGVDDREYTLSADDVVTLPEANATPLIERDAAEQLQ